MISTKIINNTIRIVCTQNQTINVKQLKEIYRTVALFINQNNSLPILVELEKNVKISPSAKKIFERIDNHGLKTARIIISG